MPRRNVAAIWIYPEDKKKFESHMKYGDTQAAKFHEILHFFQENKKKQQEKK